MIVPEPFAYRSFSCRPKSLQRASIGIIGLLFLCCATASAQRISLDAKQPKGGGGRISLAPPTSSRLALTTERSQRLGVQQVGEATAEAARTVIARATGPEIQVHEADTLVEKGKFDEAIAKYEKIIEGNPQLVSAVAGLGYAYFKKGDYDLAVNQYEKAVAKAPSNTEAQLNLGVALYRSGRIEESIEQYKKTIAVKQQNHVAHFNMAMAYAHTGNNDNFAKSIEHYKLAIAQKKAAYPEAYNNMGLVYEAMGKIDEATKNFRLAVENQKGGNYPLANYNLGRLYRNQGNYGEAETALRLAIKQQPEFAEANLELGNVYLILYSVKGTQVLDKSIASYKRAIEIREGFYPLAHENLGIALTKDKKISEAVAEYKIAFEQYEGECPETMQNLLTTVSEDQQFVIGNELSREDNAGNLTSKKDVAAAKKRLDDKLKQYEEMDDEYKTDSRVRYCAGLSYAALGNWQGAVNELTSAVTLSKNQDADAARALNSLMSLVQYF